MIGHHRRRSRWPALIAGAGRDEECGCSRKRIEVSQADEIKMMQDWLEARGQPLPDPHAHHAQGATLMPGMLTPEEMARLLRRPRASSSIGCSSRA